MATREVRTRLSYQLDDRGIRRAQQGMSRLGVQTSRVGQAFSAARIPMIGTVATLGAVGAATFAVVAGLRATIGAAISFESAFTGVRKTINASEAEFEVLERQFRDLALEVPIAINELLRIGELGGQLGIAKEGIIDFTRTVGMLKETTVLTGEAAGTFLARFANIMGLTNKEFERVGATLVDLGNNAAATEADIASFALRIAGAGRVVGLTAADVLGLATALASVGLRAQAGGTAISRTLITMAEAVAEGEHELEVLAAVADMSVQQFVQLFEVDAAQALQQFIVGLNKVEQAGGNVFRVLDELGLGEIRVRDALLRAAGAQNLFNRQLELAKKAYAENTALLEEFNRRAATTESKITLAKNALKDLAIEIGQTTLPLITALSGAVAEGAIAWTDYVRALRAGGLKEALTGLAAMAVDIDRFFFGGFGAVGGQGNRFRDRAKDIADAARAARSFVDPLEEMERAAEDPSFWIMRMEEMAKEMDTTGNASDDFLARLEALMSDGLDPAASVSIPNFTAELVAAHPAVQALSLAIEQQEAVIEAQRIALQAFQDGLRDMQRELQATQSRIRDLSKDLSDAQRRMQEFLQPKFKGQGALEERIFQLQAALRRIQMAELRGGPAQLTGAMQQALGGLALDPESIQRALRSLQLQLEDLTAEPLRRLAEAAAGPTKELTFEEAMAGLLAQKEAIKGLEDAISSQTASLRAQQAALQDARDAMVEMNRSIQEGQARLRKLQEQQRFVTESLQKAFDWYFNARKGVMDYGGEAAEQGKKVDDAMRKLLLAITEYSVNQSETGMQRIRDLRREAENAVIAVANAVARAQAIMEGMPAPPSFPSTVPGAQHGGIFSRPTNILVGEAGPEAVVPLGASAGGGTSITIQAQAFMGNRSEARAFARQIAEFLNEEQRLRQGKGTI